MNNEAENRENTGKDLADQVGESTGSGDPVVPATFGRLCRKIKSDLGQCVADQHGTVS